jgi:hypothetical protein
VRPTVLVLGRKNNRSADILDGGKYGQKKTQKPNSWLWEGTVGGNSESSDSHLKTKEFLEYKHFFVRLDE